MHRRIAPLLLSVLIALPVVAPATAAEPSASPPVEPTATPLPEPTPNTDPALQEPAASTETAPAPGADRAPTTVVPAATEPAPAEPDPAPEATPADPAPEGAPDATGRFIVMLRSNADTAAVVEKVNKRDGIKADRSFKKSFRGFSAKLDHRQKRDLLADPNVVALVPDEVVRPTAQTVPTGVARVGGRTNTVAAIDGSDHRVDADVAIVDTGISRTPTSTSPAATTARRPTGRPVARQEQPWDARRGHRRRARQRHRRRRRRAGRPRVGRQDPERRRLRPHLLVHLRPRLDPRPARPGRPEPGRCSRPST